MAYIPKPPPNRRPPGYGSWHGSNTRSETYCQYCGNGYSRSLDNCLTCGASMYYVKRIKKANAPILAIRNREGFSPDSFFLAILITSVIAFVLVILYFITQVIFQ